MMKKLLPIVLMWCCFEAEAQTTPQDFSTPTVRIWNSLAVDKGQYVQPDACASIDMGRPGGRKGFLWPRTSKDSIVNPKPGLFLYHRADSSGYYFDGLTWRKLLTNSDSDYIQTLVPPAAPETDPVWTADKPDYVSWSLANSTFLNLGGGTLTGGLSGTTANFSGAGVFGGVTSNGPITVYNPTYSGYLALWHVGNFEHRLSAAYHGEYINFGPDNGITINANRISLVGSVAFQTNAYLYMYGTNAMTFDFQNLYHQGDTRHGLTLTANYTAASTGGSSHVSTLRINPIVNTYEGTLNAIGIRFDPTVNTTGGTTTLRGIYWDPQITGSVGVKNHVIEATSGSIVLPHIKLADTIPILTTPTHGIMLGMHNGINPALGFYKSGAPTDQKSWFMQSNDNELSFEARADNFFTATTWLRVRRNGITIQKITVTSDTVRMSSLSGSPTHRLVQVDTDGNLSVSSVDPSNVSAYVPTLSVTTTGTSGPATMVNDSTINIPNYAVATNTNCPSINLDLDPSSMSLSVSCFGAEDGMIFLDTTGVEAWIDDIPYDDTRLYRGGNHIIYARLKSDSTCSKTYIFDLPQPQRPVSFHLVTSDASYLTNDGEIQVIIDDYYDATGAIVSPFSMVISHNGSPIGTAAPGRYRVDTGWHTIAVETWNSQYSGFCADTQYVHIRAQRDSGAVNVTTTGTYTVTTLHRTHEFNGTTTTATLPAIAGNKDIEMDLVNTGSGNVTINASGGSSVIKDLPSGTTSPVNTFTLGPTQTATIYCNGTYWVRKR